MKLSDVMDNASSEPLQRRREERVTLAGKILAHEGLDRKTMAKVMQAWTATGIHGTQSNLPGQGVEGPVNLAFVQPVVVLVYEEMALGARTKATVPAFHVVGQDLTS